MKILVIRFSSIGDIVLTSPVIRCLKKQLNAELHFVTKSAYRSLLAFNPHIDKIFLFEDRIIELIKNLKLEEYDLIVDLHNNLRSNLIRSKLKVRSIGFKKLTIEKAIMVLFKWNLLPDKHLIDRYFDALKRIGVVNDHEGLEFYLRPEIPLIWDKFKSSMNLKSSYVALVLGGTYYTKKVPGEKWLEIINSVTHNYILIGGKAESALADWLEDHSNTALINAVGIADIQESAFMLSKSDLVITGDTGMMHIAAALNKPIISIWGNTIPEFGMYPYYGNEFLRHFRMEVKYLSCRPCSKLGKSACPKKHFRCMVDQDTTKISKNMEFILENRLFERE